MFISRGSWRGKNKHDLLSPGVGVAWGDGTVEDRLNRLLPERLNHEKVFQDSRALVASCGAFPYTKFDRGGGVYSRAWHRYWGAIGTWRWSDQPQTSREDPCCEHSPTATRAVPPNGGRGEK